MVTLLEEILNAPKILSAGEGSAYCMGPQQMTIKLVSAETGGNFVVSDVRIDEPGFGPPYHVHSREDELFMVKEGELEVTIDGKAHAVKAGGMVYAPRNVPHTFRSGPHGVRFTAIVTGSNFEQFHRRYSEAMESGDLTSIPAIAAEHGISFIA